MFGDEGLLKLLDVLQQIKKLQLMSCEITATGVKALAEKLFETGHQVMDYFCCGFESAFSESGF